MKSDKIIYAKTHADFLNQAYGTSYKQYMRGRWVYNDNTWVWMVRMDSMIRDGWVNKIISENEIHEEYVWGGVPSYAYEKEKPYRIAVRIVDIPGSTTRAYHILGRYKYDFSASTDKKHILIKVEDV